ncbi:MAG: NADH:flavin oxidoreductase [Desulfomonilaceae bacterium]
MTDLFESATIKTLKVQNRSIRSATWSAVCDRKGYVTDKAVEYYGNLASGGIGLIVTGFQYIMANSVAMPYQMGNYQDDMIDGLKRLADVIHSEGGKVMGQLAHAGSRANPDLFMEDGELWGPSAAPEPGTGRVPKEMTRQEIASVVEAFGSAAQRIKNAGFDGVQIHGAHGYGVNQFLSGFTNRRKDQYGGNISKRYRFLGEVLESVRGVVGKDYPVFIKLSGSDNYEGGLVLEESLYVARRLEEDGIDCIEVSAGSRGIPSGLVPSMPNILKEEDEAYLAEMAKIFKETVKVPIVTVGGIRSPNVVSRILSRGFADYVALCRPLIREPHLINRWKNGDTEKSTCISCNGCFETGLSGLGVVCKLDLDRKNQ